MIMKPAPKQRAPSSKPRAAPRKKDVGLKLKQDFEKLNDEDKNSFVLALTDILNNRDVKQQGEVNGSCVEPIIPNDTVSKLAISKAESDLTALSKFRTELGEIMCKEAELRLREKKVRAMIKKLQRQITQFSNTLPRTTEASPQDPALVVFSYSKLCCAITYNGIHSHHSLPDDFDKQLLSSTLWTLNSHGSDFDATVEPLRLREEVDVLLPSAINDRDAATTVDLLSDDDDDDENEPVVSVEEQKVHTTSPSGIKKAIESTNRNNTVVLLSEKKHSKERYVTSACNDENIDINSQDQAPYGQSAFSQFLDVFDDCCDEEPHADRSGKSPGRMSSEEFLSMNTAVIDLMSLDLITELKNLFGHISGSNSTTAKTEFKESLDSLLDELNIVRRSISSSDTSTTAILSEISNWLAALKDASDEESLNNRCDKLRNPNHHIHHQTRHIILSNEKSSSRDSLIPVLQQFNEKLNKAWELILSQLSVCVGLGVSNDIPTYHKISKLSYSLNESRMITMQILYVMLKSLVMLGSFQNSCMMMCSSNGTVDDKLQFKSLRSSALSPQPSEQTSSSRVGTNHDSTIADTTTNGTKKTSVPKTKNSNGSIIPLGQQKKTPLSSLSISETPPSQLSFSAVHGKNKSIHAPSTEEIAQHSLFHRSKTEVLFVYSSDDCEQYEEEREEDDELCNDLSSAIPSNPTAVDIDAHKSTIVLENNKGDAKSITDNTLLSDRRDEKVVTIDLDDSVDESLLSPHQGVINTNHNDSAVDLTSQSIDGTSSVQSSQQPGHSSTRLSRKRTLDSVTAAENITATAQLNSPIVESRNKAVFSDYSNANHSNTVSTTVASSSSRLSAVITMMCSNTNNLTNRSDQLPSMPSAVHRKTDKGIAYQSSSGIENGEHSYALSQMSHQSGASEKTDNATNNSDDILASTTEPAFGEYSPAELKEICIKYGLRSDTKSKMIALLSSMWNRMHSKQLPASTISQSTHTKKLSRSRSRSNRAIEVAPQSNNIATTAPSNSSSMEIASTVAPSPSTKREITVEDVANFIKQNVYWYEKVLMHIPLEVGELQSALHKHFLGMKIARPKLIERLDELSIFVCSLNYASKYGNHVEGICNDEDHDNDDTEIGSDTPNSPVSKPTKRSRF